MPILTVVFVIVVIGIVLWAVHNFIPMDAKILKILDVVVIVALVLWLLKVFGIWNYLAQFRV